VVGITLAILGGGCGNVAKLDQAALLQQAKSLQSQAAEGALLAEDDVAGKTTSSYIREQAPGLHDGASRAQASLKRARTDPVLEPKLRRLRALATRVAAGLDRLGGASTGELRRLGRELDAAAQESQKIVGGLK
jgi:hypothetical protein